MLWRHSNPVATLGSLWISLGHDRPATIPTYSALPGLHHGTYVVESYSYLVPLRYPASVAHSTRTRGVSVFDCSLAAARKSRKLRDEISGPQRDILSFNINKLSGGEGGIRTPGPLARTPHFECGAIDHSATSPH